MPYSYSYTCIVKMIGSKIKIIKLLEVCFGGKLVVYRILCSTKNKTTSRYIHGMSIGSYLGLREYSFAIVIDMRCYGYFLFTRATTGVANYYEYLNPSAHKGILGLSFS